MGIPIFNWFTILDNRRTDVDIKTINQRVYDPLEMCEGIIASNINESQRHVVVG